MKTKIRKSFDGLPTTAEAFFDGLEMANAVVESSSYAYSVVVNFNDEIGNRLRQTRQLMFIRRKSHSIYIAARKNEEHYDVVNGLCFWLIKNFRDERLVENLRLLCADILLHPAYTYDRMIQLLETSDILRL